MPLRLNPRKKNAPGADQSAEGNDPTPEGEIMTTVASASVEVESPEMLGWALRVRELIDVELGRVRTLPEFQAWAAQYTEQGPWTLEDCAHKWVEHNPVSIPVPPVGSLPPCITDVSYERGGHREFFVRLASAKHNLGDVDIAVEALITVDWGGGVIEYTPPIVAIYGDIEDVSAGRARAIAEALTRAANMIELAR